MSVNGCKDVSITNFAIVQAPVAFINVGAQSTNIKFSNLDLSARSSSQYNPRNTDGFDIGSSSYISLDKIRIENQDDCVAFKPAADHVTVTNIECIGSHGLSIGSLGKYPGNNDTVTNVLVKGATVRGADKAAGSLDASSAIYVANKNFSMYNINVANEYTAGQAVALTSTGDYHGFYGCQFKSYQDTLFAKAGNQYYSNCYIEGKSNCHAFEPS